jgi:hypothetical protein
MSDLGTLTVIVLALAAYRLTRLVTVDEFPFGKLRDEMHGSWFGKLITCPFCVSVWLGGFLAVGQGLVGDGWGWQVFIGALALSGVVSLTATLAPQTFD